MSKDARGFSLLEVIISIAILAAVIIILLERRNSIIDEAYSIKVKKEAWTLVAKKIAEIELEDEYFQGDTPVSMSGDFEEMPDFSYNFTVQQEDILVSADENIDEKERTKKIYHITLDVSNKNLREELPPIELHYYLLREKKGQ